MSNPSDFIIKSGVLKEYTGKGGAVIIPEDVTVIGEFAFCGRKGLRSVTIPENVVSIQRHAFAGCGKINLIINGELQKASSAFDDTTVHITIKHWSSCVTKLLQEALVERINIEDYSSLPAKYQITAVLSVIEDKKWDPKSDAGKAVLEYLEKNAAKLCKCAFDHPAMLKLLCSFALIHAKDMDVFTTEAEKRKDTELKALLLNYQNKLGQDTVAKARAKKEKVKEEYEDALVDRITTRDPSKGIDGMTFVITGQLDKRWTSSVWQSRSEIQDYLSQYGAKLGSSVTKQTDYLVTNDTDSGSEKNRKAAELGVPVISEADFNEMVGRRFKDEKLIRVPGWLRSVDRLSFCPNGMVEQVVLEEGVESIGQKAFELCKALKEIALPSSLKTIGDKAFYWSQALKAIHIADLGAWCDTVLESVSASPFKAGGILYANHAALSRMEIPNGVKTIKKAVFAGCRGLEKLTLSDSIGKIEERAFSNCSDLTEVCFGKKLRKIGKYAFSGCVMLTGIVIPAQVKTLEEGVLYGCKKLEKVTVMGSIAEVGDCAFEECGSLKEIKFIDGLKNIGLYAFRNCMKLTDITLPGSVESIENSAFMGCKKLTIHAPAGSYAEQYAKEHNIPFVAE